MISLALHPATRLLLWFGGLIAAQCLRGGMLVAAIGALLLLGPAVRRRGGKLVWRTRWLLASLFVIFAWGTAGDPLWPSSTAPTIEGLLEASTHVGRLVLVLLSVAAFLEWMPMTDLLAATHTALSPFARLGLDPDRGVVRLMLALRYAETLPRVRDWRTLLAQAEATRDETLEIHRMPFRWLDVVAAALTVLILCLAVLVPS